MTEPTQLTEDLKKLLDAIETDNVEVIKTIQNNYQRFLKKTSNNSNSRSLMESITVDTLSSCLLPQDVPTHLTPRKVTGNGDCFFNIVESPANFNDINKRLILKYSDFFRI